MPRKIKPQINTPTVMGLCDTSELTAEFWKNLQSVGVPSEAQEDIAQAVLAYILETQQSENEMKRPQRLAVLDDAMERAKGLRNSLQKFDLEYFDAVESYLRLVDPNGPGISDYIHSLDMLASAIRRSREHDDERTRHGPTAWPGHKLAERIGEALCRAGCVIDDRGKGMFVRVIIAAIEEANPLLPKTEKHLDPDETARNWARSCLPSLKGE